MSLSSCRRFRFRTLSLVPKAVEERGISPFPGERLFMAELNALDRAGVRVDVVKFRMLSVSGVSGQLSEMSVIAGLSSAAEASERASISNGFLGVVKAGLRNGGAVFVRWKREFDEENDAEPRVGTGGSGFCGLF
jgi:hypothetical protein